MEEVLLNCVYHESNLETMSRLKDNSIHLVVSSPPYDDIMESEYESQWNYKRTLEELYRILVPGGVVCWNVDDQTKHGSRTLSSLHHVLYSRYIGFNIHQKIVWSKSGFSFPQNNRYHHTHEDLWIFSKGTPRVFRPVKRLNCKGEESTEYDVWNLPNGIRMTEDRWIFGQHPCPFSEELVRRCVYTWSNPEDIVYDPFGGSGTVGKVCLSLHRRFLLSEVSEKYVKLTKRRLQEYLEREKDLYQSLSE